MVTKLYRFVFYFTVGDSFRICLNNFFRRINAMSIPLAKVSQLTAKPSKRLCITINNYFFWWGISSCMSIPVLVMTEVPCDNMRKLPKI